MYKLRQQGWLKHLDFILWDAFALQAAFILAYFLRVRDFFPYDTPIYARLGALIFTFDVLTAILGNTMHNVMKRNISQEIVQTVKQVLIVLAGSIFYIFFTKNGAEYSRIVLYLTFSFYLVFGFAIRVAWKAAVRKIWKNSDKKASVILVADEKRVPEILSTVTETDAMEYTGVVLTNRDGTGSRVEGIAVVAGLDTAAEYICREYVDEVYFCREDKESADMSASIDRLIAACHRMAVVVHVYMPIIDHLCRNFRVERRNGDWTIAFAPETSVRRKRRV